jgi:hypothetical protein
MINEAVERFNEASMELQATEFRHATTPDEWRRVAKNPAVRDYARLCIAVTALVEAFEVANSTERASVGSKLTSDAMGILRTFAGSMPVLAVRRQSPELIAQGLTALAILEAIDDLRDLTFYLAALHYSAIKLQLDARKMFAEVASLVPSIDFQNEMRGFPLRASRDRDLAAFGFRETRTNEGFDLVQDSGRVNRWLGTKWRDVLRRRLQGLLDRADQGGEVGLGSVVPFHQNEVVLFLKFDCLGFGAGALHGVEGTGCGLVPADPHFGRAWAGIFRRPTRGFAVCRGERRELPAGGNGVRNIGLRRRAGSAGAQQESGE